MMFRRIFLFLAVNFLVVITLSILMNLFHVAPYLTQYGINYKDLLIFCFIWGMGGAFISLGLSRIMAKWIMGVKLIDANTSDPTEKQLLNMIERLSNEAGLPEMPQVGIYQGAEVNAFATGPTKRRSLVAVSSGLLQKMSDDELEGVLAHEISHIANGDMVTMTLLQGVINAFVMFLSRVLAYIVSTFLRDKRQGSQQNSYLLYTVFVILFEVVFMILGSLVVAAYSRRREYRADRGGALLAGKEKMVGALQALQAFVNKLDEKKQQPAMQAFKISTPKKTGWLHLFATHPPLELRIERLKKEQA